MAHCTSAGEDSDTPTSRQKSLFESRRGREFYRYYEPIRALTTTGPPLRNVHGDNAAAIGSPDPALTAFCQLGALRMATRRALLFFFDQDYAYVLAEATRSLSLLDDSIEDVEDGIWLGHSKIPRGHSVCEYTTLNLANPQGNYRFDSGDDLVHVISDLRADTAFCDRPFVVGGPKARFYAGVPITTNKGINIGAYCLLDDKPRENLKPNETRFLRHMAMTVMKHLEMVRAKAQMERGNRMVAGLGAFVEEASVFGRSSGEEHTRSRPGRTSSNHKSKRSARHSRPDHATLSTLRTDGQKSVDPFALAKQMDGVSIQSLPVRYEEADTEAGGVHRSSKPASAVDKPSTSQPEPEDFAVAEDLKSALLPSTVRRTFQRAAVIVRDSVEVDGAVFLDASIGSYGSLVGLSSSSDHSERDSDGAALSGANEEREQQPCIVLGASYQKSDRSPAGSGAEPRVGERLIRRLLRRYPRGKIWNFNNIGSTSSDDDSNKEASVPDALERQRDRKRAALEDGRRLAHHFPGVRSLAIIGLWDQRAAKWHAACVVFSFSAFRIPAYELEMSFLYAFGDVIMAEVHRHEAQKSDRQKMDFISSISHELRSPLHGILGTVECLLEEVTDSNSLHLVSQVEACGRTLLDIVNHLLDHSKINYYGRGVRKSLCNTKHTRKERSSADGVAPHLGSMESLDAVVSLDKITEEVVDTTFYSFCCSRNKQTGMNQKVSLVLDIDCLPSIDWRCRIAVGGWKRVIINLVSNALKYTKSGYIQVSLKAIRGEMTDSFNAVLTIRDTGCGMSKTFLHDRLFLPFAQENSYLEGTGLGMSLVATIIKAMRGKVEVESEQNVGTTVTAVIPLEKYEEECEPVAGARDHDILSPPAGLSIAMPSIRDGGKGDATTQSTAQALLVESMARLCRQMDIRTVDLDEGSSKADILLNIEEGTRKALPNAPVLDAILQSKCSNGLLAEKPLIVICRDAISAREFKKANHDMLRHRHVEVIAQPVGPERLVKAIQACLEPQAKAGAASHKDDHMQAPNPAMERPLMAVPPQSRSVAASQPSLGAGSQQHLYDAKTAVGQGGSISPSKTKAAAPTGLTLLLVDDNPINLQLLSTYASRHGHDQIRAHNGQQAVDAYKAACLGDPLPSHLTAIQSKNNETVARTPSKPRVILMDISMPVLNGFEATRLIRQFEQSHSLEPAKVIALTGLGSASAQQEAYSSGIDLFLTKPCRLKDLSSILNSVKRV